jgi:F-type H+-transporting ATPase subunit delta
MKNIRIYRTYARIFFFHAKNVQRVKKIIEDFDMFNSLCMSDIKLARIFSAPICSSTEKTKLFKSILTARKFDPLFVRFIEIMIKNRVMPYLSDIYNEFLDLSITDDGKVSAKLISASNMNDQNLKKCQESLEKYLGKKLVIKHTIDPNIIGGVILKFGSMMYDASVLGAMRKLRRCVGNI